MRKIATYFGEYAWVIWASAGLGILFDTYVNQWEWWIYCVILIVLVPLKGEDSCEK